MNAQSAPTRGARLAGRQSMRWVGFYTGLVDPVAAERRRGEIASDLWEQRAAAQRGDASGRWLGLSIVGRTVAGMAADISWVRVQRTEQRRTSQSQEGALAQGLTRFVLRWWWALGAMTIALAYMPIARTIWNEPGRPYADQLLLLLPATAMLWVGSALRAWRPRAAATMVIIGTLPAFMAWWAPGMLAAATLVVIGSVAELAHLTTAGATGRHVALAAILVLVTAMVAPFAVGFGPVWVALAVGALLVLVLSARRRTPAGALS